MAAGETTVRSTPASG